MVFVNIIILLKKKTTTFCFINFLYFFPLLYFIYFHSEDYC